jgi:hypothetical protein
MTAAPYKLGALDASGEFVEFHHEHVFARGLTTGPERLIIGPREKQVPLLLALARELPEPYVVLYVLLISRCGRPSGRYQSPELDAAALEQLFDDYRDYFENDGRHHVWIMSPSGTIVYDQHDLIYAYGPLEAYERTLEAHGLRRGQARIPAPHGHQFNPQHDGDEERIFERWPWLRFPLAEDDDP